MRIEALQEGVALAHLTGGEWLLLWWQDSPDESCWPRAFAACCVAAEKWRKHRGSRQGMPNQTGQIVSPDMPQT